MFDFDYDDDGNFYINDFSMVIDNGRDIDMQQICDCANHIDEFVTMDWCEQNCPKYYRCCNISLADDILKAYEEGVKKPRDERFDMTHVFHMPNGTHVIKIGDADALDFIREQTRLGCRLVSSSYRNNEYVYELR